MRWLEVIEKGWLLRTFGSDFWQQWKIGDIVQTWVYPECALDE
jgi:hypothetical protein